MTTNELDLHNNKVAQLIEYGVEGSVRDVEFLYEDYRYDQIQMWQYIYIPTKNVRLKCSIFLPHRSCENNKIPHIWPCEKDPTMGDLSFRYYNITVTGTDSACNVGSDNCKVIIMPNCFPKEAGCEDDRIQFGQDYRFYPTMSEVENTTLRSQASRLLYGIVESKLHKKPQPGDLLPTPILTCKPPTGSSKLRFSHISRFSHKLQFQ